MIRTYTFKTLILICCFVHAGTALATTVIPGNQENPSFSFPISVHTVSNAMKNLYVGAGVAHGKEFAISALSSLHKNQFFGLTPEKITLNGTKDTENPLFDAPIQYLSLLEFGGFDASEHLIAVPANDLTRLYLFDRSDRALFTTQVPDARGALTSGIVGITGSNLGLVFAAAKPANGNSFGALGSGIAIALFKKASPSNIFSLLYRIAFPLDTTSPTLKIGGDTSTISINNNVVTMHWNSLLARLFIGLQVAPDTANGARAIVVARIENNKLYLEAIAPSDVFTGPNNKIVGSLSSATSIHEIKSLTTTTSFTYLIVRGGTGNPEETNNSVYALPLVNHQQDQAVIGTIASVTASDTSTPATTPAQMITSDSPAAIVGGAHLTQATITEINICGDTLFASTSDGIFYSQALFDQNGKIKNWTTWQRYAGVISPINAMIIDSKSGDVTTIANVNNNTEALVSRTQWNTGSTNTTASLIAAIGPIEQAINFPALTTPGLANISILATTYNNSVTLAQTGTVVNSTIEPTLGAISHTLFTNGAITENFETTGTPAVISISGGVLSAINPITQVAIGKSSTDSSGWIFCGGDRGLAVLSTPAHEGWTNLESGFKGLTNTMSFKSIGDYSYIKKLIIDGDYLYVLTDTLLDRIAINSTHLDPNALEVTHLALLGQEPLNHKFSFFNDLVVSDKLALLATNYGLFRVGNGQDISNAPNPSSVNWTPVTIPNNFAGPVLHLYAKSTTGSMQDCAKNNTNGQLYVLCADRSKNRAQLNRFSIASVEIAGVTDETLQPLPDSFKRSAKSTTITPSYYINFGDFRDLFATDGALYFHARGKENTTPTNLQVIPHILVNSGIQVGHNIPSMVQNSALGTWLIGNEKGMHTNE